MKNGLLVWNVILSLVAGYLLIVQFGAKKGNASSSKKSGVDTAMSNQQFRMAYFEMDSVASNFDMVKGLKTEMTNKEDAINTEMTNRTKAIQQKYTYYQNNLSLKKISSAMTNTKGL